MLERCSIERLLWVALNVRQPSALSLVIWALQQLRARGVEYPDDESLQRRMRYKPRYVVDDLPAALGASTVQTDFNSAPVGPPGRR